MPAKSKQQQKFFGVVKAMQAGDIPKKGEAGEVADDMSKKEVDKYASTKHKGLPKKVKQETMKRSEIKQMVREEFFKALEEAKMTPAKVQKVQRDLVKTIDALKKNFPMYKAAKESGDEKKLAKHRDIALKLTKKKKDLELQMDKALGGLYQDAELELEASRIEEGKTTDGLKADGMAVFNSYMFGKNYIDPGERNAKIRNHKELEKVMKKDKAYQQLDPRQKRIAARAINNIMSRRLEMER